MHSTAKVTRVTASGVYVELPGNPGFSYGPCVSTVAQVNPGDVVVVVPCDENDPEAMAVVGITPPPSPPVGVTMADVNARLAALGLSAGTAGALAAAKAYAAQQAAQALTDGKAYTDGKVAPLATTAALNAAVAPLATTAAMTTGDTNTLASSKAYTDGKVAPLATTAALDWSNLIHNNRLDALEAVRPAGSVYKSSAQLLAANTTTVVAMNVTRRVQGGMTLTGGALYVPRTGWYSVSGSAHFASATSASRRIVFVGVSDSATAYGSVQAAAAIASAQNTASSTGLSVSATVYAVAGQYLNTSAYAATAWQLDVSQGYMCTLSAAYVCP